MKLVRAKKAAAIAVPPAANARMANASIRANF
jgi:hypothetical protein